MLSITTPTHANLWQACPISVSRCVLFCLFSKWWRLTSVWFLMVARHIAWTWLAWQTPIATEARFAWSSSPRTASTGLRSCGLIRKSADPSGRAEPVWAELFQILLSSTPTSCPKYHRLWKTLWWCSFWFLFWVFSFKRAHLAILCVLFRMVKWPFKRFSDL